MDAEEEHQDAGWLLAAILQDDTRRILSGVF